MKKKVTYIKCPRCDLNYIDKKQKLCDVCKAELKLLDPSILIPDEDDEDERLCPICRENFITAEEDMCFECSKEHTEKQEDPESEDEEWEYVAEVVDEPLPVEEIGIDLSGELDDEEDLEEDDFAEEEFEADFEDDFEDDIDESDFEDDDIDDEDEDEDDDEDFAVKTKR